MKKYTLEQAINTYNNNPNLYEPKFVRIEHNFIGGVYQSIRALFCYEPKNFILYKRGKQK